MSKPRVGEERFKSGRRTFLRGIGLAGGAATVAAVSTGVRASAENEGAGPVDTDQGYRLTQHVRDYYKSTKL